MKVTQHLGLLKLEGYPNPQEVVDRYTLPVWNYALDDYERVPFAALIDGSLYVPPLTFKHHYQWREPKRIQDWPNCSHPTISLRGYQRTALAEWMLMEYGILKGLAGCGKTTVGAALLDALRVKSLVITPTIDIARQWRQRIQEYIPGLFVGMLGGGEKTEGAVTVATYQTAIKHQEVLVVQDCILIDECHRTACRTIRDILTLCPAKFRYGCTATPWRADGLHKALDWLLGGVTVEIREEDIGGHVLPVTVTQIPTDFEFMQDDYTRIQTAVAQDGDRNEMLIGHIKAAHFQGHTTMVLCNRVDQIAELGAALASEGVWCAGVTGKASKADREQVYQEIRTAEGGVLLATYQLAAEGLDLPELSCLIMAAPIGNPTKVEQACGRIARPCEGKLDPVVVDFVDKGLERYAAKRRRVYKAKGYEMREG